MAGLRALPAMLLLSLALPLLTGFTSFREPGLLPGNGLDEGVVTLADLARLRSQPQPPPIGARSAIVWDATNGAELYAKAPDERVSPASTTKILTALLIIEWGKLDQRVTIERRDFDEWDDTVMCLEPGDTVTVEDLLYGILLPSGTDAALAAARTVGSALLAGAPGDPVARFVEEMNARVARLGLTNTQFRNPHGNDAEGQYTSARDLVIITNEALQKPLLAQIVNTKQTTRKTVDGQTPGSDAPTSSTCAPQATRRTISGETSFTLTNTNELLGRRDGVHGVKTGTTAQCGRCLVTAQWGPAGRLLTVVLGSADRYGDTIALLDWTNAAYRWLPLGRDAELPGLKPALARWGVGFREARTVVLPAWEVPTLRYRLLLEPGAGAGAGEVRGLVVFLAGTREVLSLPVYALEGAAVERATPAPASPARR